MQICILKLVKMVLNGNPAKEKLRKQPKLHQLALNLFYCMLFY